MEAKPNQAFDQIAELAHIYLERKAIVDDTEVFLKKAKKGLDEIETGLLPEAMLQANVLNFETPDHIKVEIKEDITLALKSGNPKAAYKWLRDNDHGSLIKNTISVVFGKGQDSKAVELAKLLIREKYEFDQKDDVNSGSLKAVLRKELEGGEKDVPLDTFGATQYKKAIVKVKN